MSRKGGIFIVSSERSGSNFLRSMLGAHSELAAPPAQHILKLFSKILPLYGPLDKEENFDGLCSDVLSLINLKEQKYHWKYEVDFSSVKRNLGCRNLVGLLEAAYDAFTEQDQKSRWVCKENDLFAHAQQIILNDPKHKLIYLVRDGRDVCVSERKIPHRKRHVFLLADQWNKEQGEGIRLLQSLPIGNIHLVRYEDLIRDAEPVLKNLCDFIGIPYESKMLRFYEQVESKAQSGKSEFWKNLDKPVMKSNMGKFRKELSSKQITLYEAVCKESLSVLGYPLITEPTRRVSIANEAYFRLSNKLTGFVQQREQKSASLRRERVEHFQRIVEKRNSKKKVFAPKISYS